MSDTDPTSNPSSEASESSEPGPPPRLTRSRKSDQATRPGFRDPANARSKAMKKQRKKKRR